MFEGELAETIPVVHASIAGCRIIGRMCVGKPGKMPREGAYRHLEFCPWKGPPGDPGIPRHSSIIDSEVRVNPWRRLLDYSNNK